MKGEVEGVSVHLFLSSKALVLYDAVPSSLFVL